MAKKKISILLEKLKITTMNEAHTQAAASNKKVHDLEDGLQYYSAIDSACTCIVSYDRNDFHFSEIEVLDAQEFLFKYAVRKSSTKRK